MIKRPMVWIFFSYIAGVILADRHRSLGMLISYALLILIIFLMLIRKVSNRYINKTDRFLLILPAFMYIGILLMGNHLKEPYLNKFYEDKVSGWITGTLYQIEEKEDKVILFMKENSLSILNDNFEIDESINISTNKSTNSSVKMNNDLYIPCDKIIIYYDKSITNIKIGNKLKIYGQINILQHNTNPGQFDEYQYYKTLGIDYKVYADNVTVIDSSYSRYHHFLYQIKKRIQISFSNILNKKEAGLLTAMLLGDKSKLDAEINELYQENGISHVLAISGLNVSLIGLFIYYILRKLHCNIYVSVIFSIFFIYSFGVLTNFSVSTNRAVVMLVVSYIAIFIGRTYDVITSLALSALLILIQNPMQIYSVGFLLSFGAVLGIAIFMPIFKELFRSNLEYEMEKNNNKEKISFYVEIMKNLKNGMLLSLGINIITTPIILLYFYEFPLYSIIINLIILPFSSILLLITFLGGIAGCFSIILGKFLIAGAHYILIFYELVCRIFIKLPYHKILVGKPSGISVFIYYIFVILFVLMFYQYEKIMSIVKKIYMKKIFTNKICINTMHNNIHIKKMHTKMISKEKSNQQEKTHNNEREIEHDKEHKKVHYKDHDEEHKNENKKEHELKDNVIKKKLLLILLFTFIILIPKKADSFTVTFLDVGQGDGIFIKTPTGSTYLIDGGSTSVSSVGTYRIEQYLKYMGNGSIDYAIMTHADSDHISGLLELIEGDEIDIKHLVLPNTVLKDDAYLEIVDLAKQNNIPILYIQKGDKIEDGEVIFTCLHPDYNYQTTSRNAYSTVLSVTYHDFDMLLTGDVEEDGELEMIKSSVLKDYDILKVAHHGSKYSTIDSFLDIIKPEIAIISCGKNNRYGHPHEELIERLNNRKSKVYTTMESGAITIQTDGKSVNLVEYAKRWKE